MYIELIDSNKISIGMNNYIQESIEIFDEDVSIKLLHAANKNIHELNTEYPILLKKKVEDFHFIVANNL